MATPTQFSSAYNVGDNGYILTDIQTASPATVVGMGFTPGCNPAAFVPGTDFTYVTNVLAKDGITQLKVIENFFFPTKAALITYINTLP